MNNKRLYPEMKSMCSSEDYVSVCVDFSGYDSQISKYDYIEFVKILSEPNIGDYETRKLRDFLVG